MIIGDYLIKQDKINNDKIIILHRKGPRKGEGGQFNKSDFLKAIDQFYNDNF